jgi:transposase
VLTLPPTVRIFLAPGVTDMRKSFDGLAGAARQVLRLDPLSGHVFLFSNRRRTMVKILLWDRSGFWVFAKRLERGTFAWPAADASRDHVELRSEELALLIGGLDPGLTRRRRWYERRPQASTP